MNIRRYEKKDLSAVLQLFMIRLTWFAHTTAQKKSSFSRGRTAIRTARSETFRLKK